MDVLLFFPEPYPDEDFRSIVYRYHVRSGNVAMKYTKKELFNLNSYKLSFFPRNLSYLLSKMPNNFNDKYFLSHSWFPIFSPFLLKERLKDVHNDIMYGTSRDDCNVNRVIAQKNIPVISKEVKYCPQCMNEDFNNYGESYVHLTHQLDFIDFCPKHWVRLVEKCLKCGKYLSDRENGFLTIKPCCSEINYTLIKPNRENEFKLKLIVELEQLKLLSPFISFDDVYSRLLIYLGTRGYIDNNGRIKRLNLFKDLSITYREDSPLFIKALQDTFSKKGNVKYFFKKEKMVTYLLVYVYLIIFLAGSVKEFFKSQESYSIALPFGTGPWYCYNKFCQSYLEKIIFKYKCLVREDIKGIFECPICGFKYQKIQGVSDDESDTNIISRGHLWEEKVKELYSLGHRQKYIAEVSGTKKSVIKNFLRKLKNTYINAESDGINSLEEYEVFENGVHENLLTQSEIAATSIDTEIERKMNYRQKIVDLLSHNSDLNRTKVLKLACKEYRWLFKEDYEWLQSVFPSNSKDYSRLDSELQEKVIITAKELYNLNPANRIRKYTILNHLNKKDKNKVLGGLEKLPKTKATIESYIETVDDYYVRHVPVIVAQLKSRRFKSDVTFESIASFRESYRNCSDKTKKRVQEVLDNLQNNHKPGD